MTKERKEVTEKTARAKNIASITLNAGSCPSVRRESWQPNFEKKACVF